MKNPLQHIVYSALGIGALAFACLFGLYSDALGLERFLAMAEDRWIQMPWWLWLAPLGLAFYTLSRLLRTCAEFEIHRKKPSDPKGQA